MGKTPDMGKKQVDLRARVCRVAYILNNDQPVRSTIIGDQPLFYMDYEGALDEECGADCAAEFGFAAIEAGIEDLQRKIGASSVFAPSPEAPGAYDAAADERVMLFGDELRMATLPKGAGEEMLYEDTADLCADMRASRVAAAYLDFAATHEVDVSYSRQVATAHYDRTARVIYVNPDLPRAERMLLVARELRRVWQHRNGALLHPLTFHPDQAILVNRAQVADLAVAMVRMAWEWQLAGTRAPWERIENGAMADLARAFARESFVDFRALNNGAAAASVFEAWFMSERCRYEDRRLIQMMLADYQGYVFDAVASSQQVTAEVMVALGTMPFGKNYLAPYVGTVMGDEIFTAVRDRSNANFLWFIKFERSFREAEQDLQSDGATDGGASATDHSHKNKRIGDTNEEASIITLPRGQGGARGTGSGSDQGAAADGGGALILSFDRDASRARGQS